MKLSKIDFGDTELAFKTKSDSELRRASWLFRFMAPFSSNFFAGVGTSLASILIALRLPFLIFPLKLMFKHFCGGSTIEECRNTISTLADARVKTTLDYCIEALENEIDLDSAVSEIIRNIEEAGRDSRIPFCVFKVTSIGRCALLEKVSARKPLLVQEESEFNRVENRINTICKTAFDLDVRILIDAEESWLQNAIDDLASKMMKSYNHEKAVVFNTFQMYRKDKADSLKASYEQAVAASYFLGVKLVRGAYLEGERKRAEKMGYPSPVHETKADTDTAYNSALQFCIEKRDRIAVYLGTHNYASVQLLADLLEENGIPANSSSVYFSQLYGMGDNITFALAREGYNVAKFVPYGKLEMALPYLLRRARENSAVRGEVSRELKLIVKEMARRRTAKNQRK